MGSCADTHETDVLDDRRGVLAQTGWRKKSHTLKDEKNFFTSISKNKLVLWDQMNKKKINLTDCFDWASLFQTSPVISKSLVTNFQIIIFFLALTESCQLQYRSHTTFWWISDQSSLPCFSRSRVRNEAFCRSDQVLCKVRLSDPEEKKLTFFSFRLRILYVWSTDLGNDNTANIQSYFRIPHLPENQIYCVPESTQVRRYRFIVFVVHPERYQILLV